MWHCEHQICATVRIRGFSSRKVKGLRRRVLAIETHMHTRKDTVAGTLLLLGHTESSHCL